MTASCPGFSVRASNHDFPAGAVANFGRVSMTKTCVRAHQFSPIRAGVKGAARVHNRLPAARGLRPPGSRIASTGEWPLPLIRRWGDNDEQFYEDHKLADVWDKDPGCDGLGEIAVVSPLLQRRLRPLDS